MKNRGEGGIAPVAFALAKIRISAQQSGGTPWDVAVRPASPLSTRLEVETQLHRVRTWRDKMRSAERRQEIVNGCLVGQVDDREAQAPLVPVAMKQVVVAHGHIKQIARFDARGVTV